MNPPIDPVPGDGRGGVAISSSDTQRERTGGLLDRSAQPFLEVDFEGRLTGFNRAFEALTGYSSDELSQLTIDDISPLKWRDQAYEALVRVRETGHATRYQKEYIRKDGSVVPVEVAVDLDRDDHGHPRGFFAFVTEISERVRIENALRESEDRFRRLYDEAPFGYHEIDCDGRIVNINRTECDLLGYPRNEMLGREIFDFVAPSQREDARQAVREKFAGLRPLRVFERAFIHRDGHEIPLSIHERFRVNHANAVVGIRSTVQDLTERKAAQDALVASEERYRRLTEGCLDPIVVADGEGIITLFNTAAETTFGYRSDEILGKDLMTLIPNGLDLEGVIGHTIEMTGQKKSGEPFPIEVSLSAVLVGGSGQLVAAFRDQTERQRMRAMLAQSEKLASIGLLSAGVAHEINNPLAYVANNLAVLERDLAGIFALLDAYKAGEVTLATHNPTLHQQVQDLTAELDWEYVRPNLPRMLDRTREGVRRVANIVGNLRSLARTAPPKMEPASVADLLASALEMSQGRLKHSNIQVEQRHEPTPKFPCVAAQMGQVLLNLLVNAIQAIEEAQPAEGGKITIESRRVGGEIVLSIGDNGKGIDASELPRLFDPFYTTKPVGEGTGLGLSISHGIVTGHGGRIDVESRPGAGTRFIVQLPLKPRSPEVKGAE